MKRKSQPRINFFNASILLEDLSENEMFKLKGGTSDTGDPYEELPEVVVIGETPDDDNDGNEDEDPGYDPEDGYDWDDADNDPTDDDGWDDEGSGGDDNETPEQDGDSVDKGPWERDANGKLVTTDTGRTAEITYDNQFTIKFKEVTIRTPDGTVVTAYEVTQVLEHPSGEPLSTIPGQFKSNCTGMAFTGSDLWIFDPQDTTTNEALGFENMLEGNTYYSKVNKEDADVAVIWWTDVETGERFIAHSAESMRMGPTIKKLIGVLLNTM